MLRFACFLFLIFYIEAVPKEDFFDAMTDEELLYYFQTSNRNSVPEYEIVELPVVLSIEEFKNSAGDAHEEILDYSFSAFERPIDLKLKRNIDLTSPNFKTYIHDDNGISTLNNFPKNCHYLHADEKTVASISICTPKNIQGLIFLENTTLEVQPLNDRLQNVLNVQEPLLETFLNNEEVKIPHLVKRASFLSDHLFSEAFPTAGNIWPENEEVNVVRSQIVNSDLDFREAATSKEGKLTLELALFFDEAAYKLFASYFAYDDKKLQDMMLAYINGVQALYHHPSLGTPMELVVVRLDIMKRQPSNLPHYNGERSKLLDSFCAYQEKLNPPGDSDPDHWDMGLYVSGLDFFAYEKGKKSGVTMGLATVGGVCLDKYACVIAEFGTTNVFGKPYPSAGFTSVYIAAHEIGHNLGMHHDYNGNSCPKEGYIMSPSRGTNGETQWSTCSAEVMTKLGWAKCLQDSGKPKKNLDHNKFLETPGQKFTAKTQCEILLRDRDAIVLPSQDLSTICYNLHCKTPHRSGHYFAGPALEGTQCGNGKYCYGGNCVKKALPKPIKVTPGGWSQWKEETCKSGCIENSMGYTTKRRLCNNPVPVNTDQGCEGSGVDFSLCNDNRALDGLRYILQTGRFWNFYTPRIELNDLGISPYFPDGTLCNKAKNINYYCLQHHCLPENFKFTKTSDRLDWSFLQNANPSLNIPQDIKDYLSVDSYGRPIKTTLSDNDGVPQQEEDWETNDYIVIPWLKDRQKAGLEENANVI